MVGSGEGGGDSRSREAMGMVALHEALRNVCLTSDWTYSVFWTIRPRPRSRGGNACKVGDDNGSLMLMWEDGFCRTRAAAEHLEGTDGDDLVRKAFSKMSIQLYNYGEGWVLVQELGVQFIAKKKVASDKCHKWVFKEPSECEPSISNYWQSSFDALPPEWSDQFASGIQTIAVIQAGHGLLQLGSCKIIPEDLHFVLRMRQMFESLGYQSGFFLSQLFSSTRNSATPSPLPLKQMPLPCPPQIFNWSYSSTLHPPPVYQPSPHVGGLPAGNKDGTHLFLPQSAAGAHLDETTPAAATEQEPSDLRWPNGLSFFTALTGGDEDAKLLFGNKPRGQQHHLMSLYGADEETKAVPDHGDSNTEDFLSLESHSNSSRGRKMETSCDSKRGFGLPARMTTSSSSSSLDRGRIVAAQSMEQRVSEAGIYTDIMENFLN